MTTSSFPVLDNTDPRLKLKVENRIRNIFVTQPENSSFLLRHRKEENVNYIPVVTESSGRLLEAGVNTLQKTLVLKKQAELEEVDRQLAHKRQEFKKGVETLAVRRSELEMKEQQTKERAMKFEKFVAENEAKRRRALKKYEAARELNIAKQREIEDLTEQLKQLRARQQVLKERMAKYKIYEDYLMETLHYFPSTHLDNESESLVMPIIRRHETLSNTHRELLQRLGRLEKEVEHGQRQLHIMKQEHSIKTLMANKELSELQSELETLKEKNKQAEMNLMLEQGLSREKVEDVGCLLMAINNLAEQCYLAAYGPLENMNVLTKMDMVKEYILDKADTERRARRLMESGSALTSRAALTDKKERGSMKSISSKTQIKSPSKVSRKSGTTS
ncbi:coiled-coil domain-containing protein 42 homolog isoform X1 [Epinephelus moara]|uniref:coiled-coil domain-containing protein 42 homolog isoform X1 n=1 Tax=Epinephelus moara TaxID=300413 RepID=UPI00214F0975|nr:coiled-coil domain-containing protein 42 homolog isoform X1 [Epinephelus moara]